MTQTTEELRDAIQPVLDRELTGPRVRAIINSNDGFDTALWDVMADLGWPAVHIPERYGGVGGSVADLCVILEELGRKLAPSPFFSSAVLATGALLAADNELLRRQLLPELAAGRRRGTMAFGGTSGRLTDLGFRCRRVADGYVVDGRADFVLDAHLADFVILVAAADDEVPILLLAETSRPEMNISLLPSVDLTRRLCRISLTDLTVPKSNRLVHDDSDRHVLDRVIRFASLGLAAESSGGAGQVLRTTVDYAKTRMQFGRPIGSFQAVKHECAEMLLLVEGSRASVEHAAGLAVSGGEAADDAASVAKFYAVDSYARVAASGVQLHGGIGFTWEHDMHLHLKRAQLNRQLFGLPIWHLDCLADALIDRSRSKRAQSDAEAAI